MTHTPRRVFILTILFSFAAAAAAVANPPTHFVVTATSPVYAGAPFALTVAPYDDQGNLGRVTDIMHFASSDPGAALPADTNDVQCDCWPPYGFHGVALATPGTQTISVAYRSNPSVSGTATIEVLPSLPDGPVTHFAFDGPSSVSVGTPFSSTVTAYNAQGIVVTGYTGTVHFTSTEPQGTVPGDYTFQAGDAGQHTFSNAFEFGTGRPGDHWTLTVGDGAVTQSIDVTIGAGPTTHFQVEAPGSVVSGAPFTVVITPLDDRGNLASYHSVMHFSSSDPAATLPADFNTNRDVWPPYHVPNFVLLTTGSQSIAVTDVHDPSIHGSVDVQVVPSTVAAPTARLKVDAPPGVVAGAPFTVHVTALDAHGTVTSSYSGTVIFGSSDAAASLPLTYAFSTADRGSHQFTGLILRTPGPHQTVTATDSFSANVTGTVTLSVSPPPPVVPVHPPGAAPIDGRR